MGRVPLRIELRAVLAGLRVEQALRAKELHCGEARVDDRPDRGERVGVRSARIATRVVGLTKERLVLKAQAVDLYAGQRVQLQAVDQPFGKALALARTDGAAIFRAPGVGFAFV